MEEENVKGMAIVIALGFITLTISSMTVMCSGANIEALSLISNNIPIFSFISLSLFIATVWADKIYKPVP